MWRPKGRDCENILGDMGLARDRALQSFFLAGIVRQIWIDFKLFGAPVAQVFEQRDQCLAGGAERVGDLGRRGAHCRSSDDAILFQFTELRGENLFADPSEKIAEFSEAVRAKRKAPDRLDFPFAAQDIDGGLNGTAVVNFHRWRLRAYKFVRTSPRYRAVIPCPGNIQPARVSLNSAGRREPHKMGARK